MCFWCFLFQTRIRSYRSRIGKIRIIPIQPALRSLYHVFNTQCTPILASGLELGLNFIFYILLFDTLSLCKYICISLSLSTNTPTYTSPLSPPHPPLTLPPLPPVTPPHEPPSPSSPPAPPPSSLPSP